MKKYYCNICGNKFFPNPPGKLSCPSCSSNNIVELSEQNEESLWKSKLFLICIITLFIMLIVLFLLPPFTSNNFEVSIVKIPKECKFKVVLKRGNNPADSSLFRFSSNDGKNWQNDGDFDSVLYGTYKVKVEHRTNRQAVIKYSFLNPFLFIPDCKPKPADPCDCQKLQILLARIEKVNGQNKVVVRTNLPDCYKQYSFTGKDGPYFTDSTFMVNNLTTFEVWIKSTQCPPLSYFGNPVQVKVIAPTAPVTGKFYLESEVDPKPYPTTIGPDRSQLMQDLRGKFEKAGIYGSVRISFIVNSFGQIEQMGLFPVTQENHRKINTILDELGGWTSGVKDGTVVNTKVILQF